MKSFILLITIFISNNLIAHEIDNPPELWSSFKDLKKSKEACEVESFLAVSLIDLKNTIQNEYGIYGNIKNNKIVIKCMSIGLNKSKVMVAVAGSNRKSVEYLRNKIIRLIK